MSLSEAMEAGRIGPGGECPVAILTAGGIPGGSTADEPLNEKDRAALAAAVTPGSNAVLAKAHRYLIGKGYRVGATALTRHRRQDCRCP